MDKSSDILDCILAICMFELTRVVKAGHIMFRKDQFQFQIAHCFTHLKNPKIKEKNYNNFELDDGQQDESGEELEGMNISNLIKKMEATFMKCHTPKKQKESCKCVLVESLPSFENLYKRLISMIMKPTS